MLASDISVGNIYNVIFDPVKPSEFDGKHLAVVLKKNNDGCTFIVMPLTSSSNGEGINKKRLGSLSCLPTSLRSATTFAVYNQVRTVNASRFIKLKEGGNVVACTMPPNLLSELLILAVSEIVYGMEQDTKRTVLKRSYDIACIEHAKDLAYMLRKLTKDSSEEVIRLNLEIKETLRYTNVNPSVDFPNSIVSIIEGALK